MNKYKVFIEKIVEAENEMDLLSIMEDEEGDFTYEETKG